ncbi:MAG: hypothetical protein P8170_00880 [Gemmatimonadota bacterium]|jgi:hypothetical protein
MRMTKMMTAHLEKESAVPWWAAFGAPLLGVPLLVALLALGSGSETKSGAVEPVDAGFSVEKVETLKARAEIIPEHLEVSDRSRC